MLTTIVLLNVVKDRIEEVAEELADMDEISEVFSVAGRYDLVAMVRSRDVDDLAQTVTRRLLKVQGITGSESLFAFRVHSRHDMERVFSLGMEPE